MNIEETETLAFTYDRPFHTSQRHSKLSMNQTEPFGKMQQRDIAYFNFGWWRTLRSTADLASCEISDLLVILEFVVFLLLLSHENYLQKVARLWKYPWGKFSLDNLKKISSKSFFRFSPATLWKHTSRATFLWNYLL